MFDSTQIVISRDCSLFTHQCQWLVWNQVGGWTRSWRNQRNQRVAMATSEEAVAFRRRFLCTYSSYTLRHTRTHHCFWHGPWPYYPPRHPSTPRRFSFFVYSIYWAWRFGENQLVASGNALVNWADSDQRFNLSNDGKCHERGCIDAWPGPQLFHRWRQSEVEKRVSMVKTVVILGHMLSVK